MCTFTFIRLYWSILINLHSLLCCLLFSRLATLEEAYQFKLKEEETAAASAAAAGKDKAAAKDEL